MDEEIEAFVAAWLADNKAVLDEIVAIQGDDPETTYGAAVAAAMATIRTWTPTMRNKSEEESSSAHALEDASRTRQPRS